MYFTAAGQNVVQQRCFLEPRNLDKYALAPVPSEKKTSCLFRMSMSGLRKDYKGSSNRARAHRPPQNLRFWQHAEKDETNHSSQRGVSV